eukprot:3475697-Karenia_brevis.AAC.1
MWTTLGTKKNVSRRYKAPLRLMLKDTPFSTQYWRLRHLAVIDLQKQVGYPSLFRTRAPYERTFPYHSWVLDEMAKAQKPRQCLAGPETLHMAHVLSQLDSGYFNGGKYNDARATRRWTAHALAALGDTPKTTVTFVSRLDFSRWEAQDGHPALPWSRH